MARRVQLLIELKNETEGILLAQEIDVRDAEAAMAILDTSIEAMGGIDLLVLSAGTGDVNVSLNWPLENETIKTNVTGFAALANVAMPHFLAKGCGHLVGISSIAALRGGWESPANNASKSFVSNYLEGLRQLARRSRLPITVTDIKPGFVNTAMAKGDGIFWAAPADKAALQIYNAIERKRAHAYITHRWRLIAWILKVMPNCIYERL